jgi:hypothetical protein
MFFLVQRSSPVPAHLRHRCATAGRCNAQDKRLTDKPCMAHRDLPRACLGTETSPRYHVDPHPRVPMPHLGQLPPGH